MADEERRGGYWLGPGLDPRTLVCRPAIVDVSQLPDMPIGVHDALGVVLAAIEPLLRSVHTADEIADAAAAIDRHGSGTDGTGLAERARWALRQILDYLEDRDDLRDLHFEVDDAD